MTFLLVPSKLFRSLSASDKHTVGPICSCKPVVPCGHIVVSSLQCGRNNPGSKLGQGSILLSCGGEHYSAFCHLILQLELVSEAHCNNVLPSCSQDSWPAADRTSCGREVKVMGLKFIGVSLRRFEINGWYMPLGFSFLCRYLCPPRPLLSLYRNFLKASPWWFVGILLLYET